MNNDEAIEIAANYLEQQGWYIRHRQWEYDHRPLNLVCIDEDMSVVSFVEIVNDGCMVTPTLDDPIITAAIYIKEYHLENIPIRFDRIYIKPTSDGSYNIKHIENTRHIDDPYIFYERLRDKQRVQKIIGNTLNIN